MESDGDRKIVKTVLHAGSKHISFEPQSKVTFHVLTTLTSDENRIIDDSRARREPVQLVLGRQFKLPVWETLLQLMSLHEVAKFTVDKSLLTEYPIVASAIRSSASKKTNKKAPRIHRCAANTLYGDGLGYDDLDELLKNPQNLNFTFELLDVKGPTEYEAEDWQLSTNEKIKSLKTLKDEGNKLYKCNRYDEALTKYCTALHYIDQAQQWERKEDEEYKQYEKMKLPFLLNIAQCKLRLEDYYQVIQHCDSALQIDADNVKALYRRGVAHSKLLNAAEAKASFNKAIELDPALKTESNILLQDMEKNRREQTKVEKQNMMKLLNQT